MLRFVGDSSGNDGSGTTGGGSGGGRCSGTMSVEQCLSFVCFTHLSSTKWYSTFIHYHFATRCGRVTKMTEQKVARWKIDRTDSAKC